MLRHPAFTAFPAAVVAVFCSACSADAPAPPREPSPVVAQRPAVRSFAVYALSRGKGVPPETRAALQRVRALAEIDRNRGAGVKIVESRIGIEGETRICLEYADPREGARALDETRAIVKGVDLINVVVEPCSTRKEDGS